MSVQAGAAGYLARLIASDSTPGREHAIAELARSEMLALGFRGVHIDAAGNVVGTIGSGFPTVLVDCHLDTVPLHSAEAWTHDPFAAEVTAGRMYGLGAADMKGSVAAATYGLARLARMPPGSGTVVLVCSIAEETMEGAALREVAETVAPDVVVIGEPTDLAVNRGQRGRAKLDVTVRGRGAHVANRTDGVNAVEAMAAVIASLRSAEAMGDEAVAFSCLDICSEPDPSVSMVPHLCRIHIDCRFGPHLEPDAILSHLDLAIASARLPEGATVSRDWHVARFDTYTGRRFAIAELVPGWELSPEHPAVRAALTGASRAGIRSRLGMYGFCTNGGMTARDLGIPTIGFGVGREQEAHTVDEWVSLADLELAVRGFETITQALLGAPFDASVGAARA